jgi:hypothetical protein
VPIAQYMPIVIDAEYIRDYTIRIKFSNDVVKAIDFSRYLNGGIFEELKEQANFRKFFLDGWTIAWQNGADVAPETLYESN